MDKETIRIYMAMEIVRETTSTYEPEPVVWWAPKPSQLTSEPAPEDTMDWIGKVVRVKTGGPKMIVRHIFTDGSAQCTWWNSELKRFETIVFPTECLSIILMA